MLNMYMPKHSILICVVLALKNRARMSTFCKPKTLYSRYDLLAHVIHSHLNHMYNTIAEALILRYDVLAYHDSYIKPTNCYARKT